MEKAKAYIKSSLNATAGNTAAGVADPPADPPAEERVCFVCGGAGFGDQFSVRVKPDGQVRKKSI